MDIVKPFLESMTARRRDEEPPLLEEPEPEKSEG
jgi:hypothetical protein